MQKWKRVVHGIVAAVLSVCMAASLSVTASASGGYTRPEVDRRTSLGIHYHQKTLDFSGVQFKVYKVADMKDTVQFEFVERFEKYPAAYGMEMSPSDWVNLAGLLAGYVSKDNLDADFMGITDGSGMYRVSDMDAGLYLVMGSSHQREYLDMTSGEGVLHRVYYHVAPFLVATPNLEDAGWVYDVEVSPKFTASEDEFVSRRVLKTWDDAGYESERPGALFFDLVRDNQVYDTVQLTAANSWRYQWDMLDNSHQWRIVEHVSGNYDVSARQEGITYVVTNSYIYPSTSERHDPPTPVPDPPSPPSIPVPPTDIPDDDPPLTNVPDDTPTVTATPITPVTPKPTNPGTPKKETPNDPDYVEIPDDDVPLGPLPQTGQLWWPVPVMAASGSGLFVIGWLLSRRKRRD